MQSSGLKVEQISKAVSPGCLAKLSLVDKIPFALIGGLLLGLSAPGFDLWWLAWLGIAPLLVLIQGARSKVEAALTGLIFGMGYYMVAMGWYLGLYPLSWLGLGDWLGFQTAVGIWLLASFTQALLFAGFSTFVFALPLRAGYLPFYQRPFFPYLLSVPILWLFFHWVLGASEAFLGAPVCQLAYSQAKELELIQMCKWGGSQMVDFVLILANTALASLCIETFQLVPKLANRVDRMSPKVGVVVDLTLVAIVVIALIFWGHTEVERIARLTALPPSSYARVFIPPVPLAVVQGNISIEDARSGCLSPEEISRRYAGLAHDLGVALLVLPEGAIDSQKTDSGLLSTQLKQISAIEKKECIVGCIERLSTGFLNTVRLLAPNDGSENIYIKRRLAPFCEFMPAGPFLQLIPHSVKRLFMGNAYGFVPSPSVSVLHSIWGKIGASISIEVVYPRLIADEVRHGGSLLVNVSNFAWFHNSNLNRQVLAASVMRAVENERYMVLATNTGISAVIDPSGCVNGDSLPGKKGVLLNTVQFLYKMTPYTRMWWL